jgi:hypothetical protein
MVSIPWRLKVDGLGFRLVFTHGCCGVKKLSRAMGRGPHYYLGTAIKKGSSAALAAAFQSIIGQGRNFINRPAAGFNQNAALASVASKAFESFSQGVFAEATGTELELPVGLTLLDTFISSIAADLTDAMIKGERLDWGTVRGDASRLIVIQGISAMATEMGLANSEHAALTSAVTIWLDNFFHYAKEFEVIDQLLAILD